MNRKLVVASRNQGKLADFSLLLALLQVELVSVAEFTDEEVAETGVTFVENALLKARQASHVSGLPALADDSGLVVGALAGAPGIYSARYAGEGCSDEANNQKLLADMAAFSGDQRAAHFHCSLVLVLSADDPAPLIAEGRWQGSIASVGLGSGGFGYDPLFVPAAMTRRVAELSAAEKNRYSHRALAMQELLPRLRDLIGRDSC